MDSNNGKKERKKMLLSGRKLFLVDTFLLLIAFVVSEDFKLWNRRIHDYFFQIRFLTRGIEPTDLDIVHIDVDDTSVEVLGNDLMKREAYAKLISLLHESGCRAILSDIAFLDPKSEKGDQTLIQASAQFGKGLI